MIVTCPNCETKYNLPEEKVRSGAKLRCKVCQHIFALEAPKPEKSSGAKPSSNQEKSQPDLGSLNLDDLDSNKKPKGEFSGKAERTLKFIFIAAVLLLAIGAGLWFVPLSALDGVRGQIRSLLGNESTSTAPDSASELAKRVELLQLKNYRQYTIPNEKIGKITVVEGSIANGFTEPRDLIQLQVELFDDKAQAVMSKNQYAGTSVSMFQLQVLGEQELEQALNNKMEILSKNTNVPPGATVPFMVVLYNPPENATDFTLKILDAQYSEKK